jgi:hypothetical protein
VAADQKLERLRTDLNYVEGHLRRRYFQTGITLSEAGRKGAARRSRSHEDRDVEMALEYCRRQKKGINLSPTALKMEVGSRWKLKRSASIEAIERGLKKLSALGD